jgi:hypothetical protein
MRIKDLRLSDILPDIIGLFLCIIVGIVGLIVLILKRR